jgi:hypothetical protein
VVRIRIGLAIAALVAGVAVILVGVRGGETKLRPRPSEPVSEAPQLSINTNTSPVAAADPRRPEVMATAGRVDAPHLNCTVAVTTTGGEAWRDVGLPLAPGADNCFWPGVAFDGDGNLLVLYTPTGGPFTLPTALWLQRFTPELAADGPPVRVAGALTFQPRLAAEGRRVVVAWIAATEERATKSLGVGGPPHPNVRARAEDGGRTFAPPVTVSEPNRLAVQPTLLAGPGGQVVVGALDLVSDRSTYQTAHEGQPGPPPAGPRRLVVWRSTAGGATFAPAATVAEGVVPPQRVLIDLAPAPAFALDPSRGRIYAAWESGRDVLVSRSDDSGATWSPPRRLGPAAGGQFLPGVGVAPDGRVDVAYYDRSRDPEDVLAEVVLASSSDGGRSFVGKVISDQPFDSMVGSFNGDDVMLGSHLAVVAQPGTTTVIWPDTARGNRTTNVVDLVSATVEVQDGAGARVPLVAGGVVLLLLATALLWPRSAPDRGARPPRRRRSSPPPPRRG